MSGSDPRGSVQATIDREHGALVALSHALHADPELGLAERRAADRVATILASHGFAVERGIAGMPTAISATTGSGPFHVAICAEYDALPVVGHACGHNVICAAGVGAAIALAPVADALGIRLTLMGTPAEETAGGKIGFIREGRFDDVHAALMVHPWPRDEAEPRIIAIRQLAIRYTGKEAHAAGFPHLGTNAADAFVIAQTAIGLLRQHLHASDRVHGIVTVGGAAPNIIPAFTEGHWMVRAADLDRLDEVTELVRRCFDAGALATGADAEVIGTADGVPQRSSPQPPLTFGRSVAIAGRMIPEIGLTVNMEPTSIAPVFPALAKASIFFSFNR